MWKGRVIGFSGDADSAIRDLEEALRVFEKEYSLSDVAQALKEAAAYYITKGNVKRAFAAIRRASALYKDLEDLREQNETHLFEGIVFFSCGFNQEALDDFNKSMKISEKLIAFNEFTMTSLYSSLLLETEGNLEEALSISLGALKYSEKTDSIFLKFNNYQMLTRQYAKKRDMGRAQEFQEKLMKLFPIISEKGTKLAHASAVYANAVFFAIKEQWKQANSLFEESLQLLKTAVFSTLFEPIIKADYASCLAKQGQLVESQKLMEESLKLREVLKSRLETGEIQAYLMAKREKTVGEQLEIRLDIINVSKKPAQLLRIESVLLSAFDIKSLPSYCIQKGDSIDLTEKKIAPFEVETIKFILQPREVGIFNLTPFLSYTKDNAKETPSYAIEPIKIIVNPKTLSEQSVQTTASNMLLEFEFKTNAAKKAFNFLLMAFIQDYMQRRLPLDWSGWRTLMEIKKDANVSKYSIYGNGKSRGRAITELQNRGLVEARVFPKERGRGGKITKVRVFYERETVKRRIDQEISVA
jgi:tetratricopeptide (TPR) repeat protein